MTKRSIKRKNRKIKFSEKNYIEKNYMRGSKAVIPIELKSIDDLYMKHDYKKMELSDEICNYIDEIAFMIPINIDIILEIHSPRLTEEEQAKVKKSIKNNYGIEIDDIEFEMDATNKKSVTLAVAGILLLIFNVLIDSYIGNILSNFLCVIWWVAIWDMLELQIFDRRENKWKRLNNQQLYDSTITFVFDDEEFDPKKLNSI